MSHERFAIVLASLSLSLPLAFIVGCSAGDPSSSASGEETIAQSDSDLSLRRLCAGPQGLTCAANQYCAAIEVGRCPNKAVYGVCTARPDLCNDLFAPVCGCDGVTYGNSCFAAAAGAAVAKKGACEPKPAFCGGIAGIPCPEGQVCVDDPSDDCDPKNGGADCSGICVTKTDPCAVVRCKAGTECVDQGGVAVCLPTPTCGQVTCAAGLVCCNPLLSICTKPGGVCVF